jgi:N-acetylglucosamine-6-phosphate deacetylase
MLAETTGLPLGQLVKVTSWNQARSLGLEGFGRLESGFHADVVIVESDFTVWKTLVGGEVR